MLSLVHNIFFVHRCQGPNTWCRLPNSFSTKTQIHRNDAGCRTLPTAMPTTYTAIPKRWAQIRCQAMFRTVHGFGNPMTNSRSLPPPPHFVHVMWHPELCKIGAKAQLSGPECMQRMYMWDVWILALSADHIYLYSFLVRTVRMQFVMASKCHTICLNFRNAWTCFRPSEDSSPGPGVERKREAHMCSGCAIYFQHFPMLSFDYIICNEHMCVYVWFYITTHMWGYPICGSGRMRFEECSFAGAKVYQSQQLSYRSVNRINGSASKCTSHTNFLKGRLNNHKPHLPLYPTNPFFSLSICMGRISL